MHSPQSRSCLPAGRENAKALCSFLSGRERRPDKKQSLLRALCVFAVSKECFDVFLKKYYSGGLEGNDTWPE
jgi:hypothetical protein